MQFSDNALPRSNSCPAEIWYQESYECETITPSWTDYKSVLELWCIRQRIPLSDFPFEKEKFNFDGMTNDAKAQFVWQFKIALDI